jgi:hypothetical protein
VVPTSSALKCGAKRGGGHAPHRFFGAARNRLAIRAHVVSGRLAPSHGNIDGARRRHAKQMGDQIDVAVPRNAFAQAPAHRHATESDIGQRLRLHRDVGMMRGGAKRVMDRPDQRRAERQHANAVTRGTLGKQHHCVTAEQSASDFPGRGAGLMTGLPVDEDRSLQFRQPAEHRPSRDFAFCDEHHWRQRRDDADVEPGHMVGQDQRGTRHRAPADLANPHPDERAENPVIEMGNGALQPQVEGEADQLERQQHKRKCEEGQCDENDADHGSGS